MKQRKLTPIQAQALIRKIHGITDVEYTAEQTVAYATVDDRRYKLIYDQNIHFTGVAYRLI